MSPDPRALRSRSPLAADAPTRNLRSHSPASGNEAASNARALRNRTRTDSDSGAQPRKRVRAAQSAAVMERVKESTAYAFYIGLVKELFNKPEAEDFRAPVSELWEEEDVPGYFETISTPMDLRTIHERLEDGFYNRYHQTMPFLDEDAVLQDVRLVFKNCVAYNEPGSGVSDSAKALLNYVNRTAKTRAAARREEEREKEELARERRLQRDRERRARQKAEREAEEQLREEKKRAEEEREREAAIRRERKREREAQRRAAKREADREAARLRALQEAERARVIGAERRIDDDDEDFEAPRRKRARIEASAAAVAPVIEADHEPRLTFVSTRGLVKRRGRKNALAFGLEVRHDELMQRRVRLVDAKVELQRRRHVMLTHQEKEELCSRVRMLDFVQMKCVLQIIAQGMARMDLLQLNEIDIDIERIDTPVLREIQLFLEDPTLATADQSLMELDKELMDIEAEYVAMRYV